MALLRRGEDPNTGDEAAIARAVDDLVALAEEVDVEVSAEGAYHELQTGEYAFQQSWSGDLLSAKRFGAVAADDAGLVAYTWPARRHRRLRPHGDLRTGAQSRPRARLPRSSDGRRGRDAELPLERLPASGGGRAARSPGCTSATRSSTPTTSPRDGSFGPSGRRPTPGGAWGGSVSSERRRLSRRPRPSTAGLVVAGERDERLARSRDRRRGSRSSRRCTRGCSDRCPWRRTPARPWRSEGRRRARTGPTRGRSTDPPACRGPRRTRPGPRRPLPDTASRTSSGGELRPGIPRRWLQLEPEGTGDRLPRRLPEGGVRVGLPPPGARRSRGRSRRRPRRPAATRFIPAPSLARTGRSR